MTLGFLSFAISRLSFLDDQVIGCAFHVICGRWPGGEETCAIVDI